MWYRAGARICFKGNACMYIFYSGELHTATKTSIELTNRHKKEKHYQELPEKYIILHYPKLIEYIRGVNEKSF